MKGQFFIVFAVLILLILTGLTIFSSRAAEKEGTPLQYIFDDLKKECVKTTDLSLMNGESVTQNLNSFLLFSQAVLKTRGYEQEYNITQDGSKYMVNLKLAFGDSYLSDVIIIDRTVFS